MQTKQFALGKFVTLIIFAVCLMSLSAGIVFAYVPTLKFDSTVNQAFTSTCYLQHGNIVLFSTDSSKGVTTASVGDGKTYQVRPINSNTVQVKCAYSVISANKTFSATVPQGKTASISNVWVYGVDLGAPSINSVNNIYYTITRTGTNNLTLTFEHNITSVITNDDEVIIYFEITPTTPST